MDLQHLVTDELAVTSTSGSQCELDLARSASWQLRQGKQAGSLLAAAVTELESPLSRRKSSCLQTPTMSPRASSVSIKAPIRCEDPMLAWPTASPDATGTAAATAAAGLPLPARSPSPFTDTAVPGRRSAPHSACHSPRLSMDCALGVVDAAACPSPASPWRPSPTILSSPGRHSLSLSGSFAGITSPSSPAASPLPNITQRTGSAGVAADDCCGSSSGCFGGPSAGAVGGDGRRMQLSKSGHWKPLGAGAGEALQSQTHRALQQLHAAQHSPQRGQHEAAHAGRGARGELRRRTSESQLHDLRASCQGEVRHWAEAAAKLRHASSSRPVAQSESGTGTADEPSQHAMSQYQPQSAVDPAGQHKQEDWHSCVS